VAVADALDRLLMPPAEWTTFPAGHVPLPARFAVQLARLGLKRNWPDILVLHHELFGIELKRPGEGLSVARWVRTRRGAPRYVEGQREVVPRLERAGMRIAVCTSVVGVLDALASAGVPLRGRVAA
jgi:phosphoserine phosphatase